MLPIFNTIIPLRTAASLTLREQTIGRGLRLPYGKRTGNAAVDRMTIVAHDKFEEIINAANEETSIIKQGNIILIEDDEGFRREKEKIKPSTRVAEFIEQKEKRQKYARSDEKKRQIAEEIEVTKAVDAAIEEILQAPVNLSVPLAPIPDSDNPRPASADAIGSSVTLVISTRDLDKPEVKELIKEKARQRLETGWQITIETVNIDHAIDYATSELIEQKVKYSIDIPDIAKTSKQATRTFCATIYRLSCLIRRKNMIVSEILGMQEDIKFRPYEDLLYKLAEQALEYVGRGKTESELDKTVAAYKKEIARHIAEQMDRHSELSPLEYEVKLLKAATPILCVWSGRLGCGDGAEIYSNRIAPCGKR